MPNKAYEVVAVVLPEEAADDDAAIPRTILVKLAENDCLMELDRAIQKFVKTEKPESYYRTIPVGSTEDFVEYWIDFPDDATTFADKLRRQLSATYAGIARTRRVTPEGGIGRRPDGLAA